eukprot:4652674-Amphidinium_carterae.1
MLPLCVLLGLHFAEDLTTKLAGAFTVAKMAKKDCSTQLCALDDRLRLLLTQAFQIHPTSTTDNTIRTRNFNIGFRSPSKVQRRANPDVRFIVCFKT